MRTILMCALGLMLMSTGPAWSEESAAPKTKAPAAPTAPGAAAESASATKTIDWKGMNKKQRKDYMKKTVLPAMRKVFAEFDAKKYRKITCLTCHGDGAEKAFEMPNPDLPALPTEAAGFKALQEKKPDLMKFMGTKVKPTMAQLLGKPEFTPQVPDGFGCYGCHTKEAAPPATAK
jgi:mono/diheme cytochrome c family protein